MTTNRTKTGANRETIKQLSGIYRRMAAQARYRPAAPSDGMGTITVPLDELDLDAESLDYARRWDAEEDDMVFWVGCCDWPTREATVYAIEAARCMNGCADAVALRLLEMAAASLRDRIARRDGRA